MSGKQIDIDDDKKEATTTPKVMSPALIAGDLRELLTPVILGQARVGGFEM